MRGKILIVEDTLELAELYALYLNREGLECMIAASAEEGLPLATEGDWSLIIPDINLPGMDGFEFLEKLRKTSSLPVMILTAREADEDVIHGLGVGRTTLLPNLALHASWRPGCGPTSGDRKHRICLKRGAYGILDPMSLIRRRFISSKMGYQSIFPPENLVSSMPCSRHAANAIRLRNFTTRSGARVMEM